MFLKAYIFIGITERNLCDAADKANVNTASHSSSKGTNGKVDCMPKLPYRSSCVEQQIFSKVQRLNSVTPLSGIRHITRCEREQ